MIRVVVADDHAMFREMLRIALPRGGEVEVVGEAADGAEVEGALVRAEPDILLLDYRMPLVHDFGEMLRHVTERHPATSVILLSGYASTEVAARAASNGARGYVLKTTRLHAVNEAIRTVHSGGIWIDPNLPRRVFQEFQQQTAAADHRPGGFAELTRREHEILAWVAQGTRNAEIAQRLSISEKTVKTHLTRIFAKLDVKSRVAAALSFRGQAAAERLGTAPATVKSSAG